MVSWTTKVGWHVLLMLHKRRVQLHILEENWGILLKIEDKGAFKWKKEDLIVVLLFHWNLFNVACTVCWSPKLFIHGHSQHCLTARKQLWEGTKNNNTTYQKSDRKPNWVSGWSVSFSKNKNERFYRLILTQGPCKEMFGYGFLG